jgi:hypothetical protein
MVDWVVALLQAIYDMLRLLKGRWYYATDETRRRIMQSKSNESTHAKQWVQYRNPTILLDLSEFYIILYVGLIVRRLLYHECLETRTTMHPPDPPVTQSSLRYFPVEIDSVDVPSNWFIF